MGEVAGLAIVILSVGLAARDDAHSRAETIAIGSCADEPDLEEVYLAARGEVAHENHGPVVHLVGHEIEITVIIKVEDRGGTRAQRSMREHLGTMLAAKLMRAVRSSAVEEDHRLVDAPAGARLDAEDKFRVVETSTGVIE